MTYNGNTDEMKTVLTKALQEQFDNNLIGLPVTVIYEYEHCMKCLLVKVFISVDGAIHWRELMIREHSSIEELHSAASSIVESIKGKIKPVKIKVENYGC